VNQTPGYFSARYFASFLQFPGLLIHDEDDTETSVENSKSVHKEWKNSTLILTKGIGHNLKSTDVIRKTKEFIELDHTISNTFFTQTLHLN
jgi:pimeloyl-ACP methyl ester carboxylesterase